MAQETHYVDFFDSFTMKNRTALCRVVRMSLNENPNVEDMATVEVSEPVRKTIRVPITCLTCRYTGQRLPFPTDDVVTEEFEIDTAQL
jgi:hypothetical protein